MYVEKLDDFICKLLHAPAGFAHERRIQSNAESPVILSRLHLSYLKDPPSTAKVKGSSMPF